MNKKVIYIASTAILIVEVLAGAFLDLAQVPAVVQDVRSIGYPTYILYIVGAWKVLAACALLWPRLPRLREWAYAGVFFEMSGAAASQVLAGHGIGKYAVPLVFSLITLVSWRFQPDREAHWVRQTAN
ncbi:MAG TPA: DoxX family protein [Terracidiphilus sp.]|nr:DoxX family protein [Terracidiphilus sp.]